jgi:ribonuclease HI
MSIRNYIYERGKTELRWRGYNRARNCGVPRDPRAVQIYTDGSAYRNPGHASGCAAIARYPEHLSREDEIVVDFGCPRSTNQRMELMACIKGLEWVRRSLPWVGVTCVLVVTDSRHVADFIGLAPTWKRNDWRNVGGQPILNRDLWDDLIKARSNAGIRVDFVREPGKTTDIGRRVDKLAKAAAKRGGPDRDTGYAPGSSCRSMAERGTALPYPASGGTAVIRPYAKKPVSKREERISFNVFDEVARTHASKFYAFTTPMMACDLHRWHGYRVLFNDNPKYPQILECREAVEVPTRHRSQSQSATPRAED